MGIGLLWEQEVASSSPAAPTNNFNSLLAPEGCAMSARITKPAKTAMQSGAARTEEWVLEHMPEAARDIDPLMGWTGSGNTQTQVKLTFPTKAEAIAYAERMGLAYTVTEPETRQHIRKSYADNFKFGRVGSWTH
jgi:ETC complex I subunit conserved region